LPVNSCAIVQRRNAHSGSSSLLSDVSQVSKWLWACYILNKFIDDFMDAQNLEKYFHYSWILLLLAMVLWKAPQGFE
jgi:hypothetical protein